MFWANSDRKPGAIAVLWGGGLFFCSGVVGLLLVLVLGSLMKSSVPFWAGGEASFLPVLGALTLLLGCVPSYLLAVGIIDRVVREEQLAKWHLLAIGFLQGVFLVFALGLVGTLATQAMSELGIRMFGLWELAYSITALALAVLISGMLSAAAVGFVLRISSKRRSTPQ
jgi:hypothetical protein